MVELWDIVNFSQNKPKTAPNMWGFQNKTPQGACGV
jgi:hypothetical protein